MDTHVDSAVSIMVTVWVECSNNSRISYHHCSNASFISPSLAQRLQDVRHGTALLAVEYMCGIGQVISSGGVF